MGNLPPGSATSLVVQVEIFLLGAGPCTTGREDLLEATGLGKAFLSDSTQAPVSCLAIASLTTPALTDPFLP